MAKKSPWNMGEYKRTKQDYEAYIWCIRNNIKIATLANKEGSCWIEINIKGNINRYPNIFIRDLVWEKFYEYCRYYYDKHKK